MALMLGASPLVAQTTPSWIDSTRAMPGEPLTFEQFSSLVVANHPEADQARLVAAQARSQLTEALGVFDPKVGFGLSEKLYKDDRYYRYADASLTIPLPVGSGIKFGFERAAGSKINPDRSTPENGLFTLGLSLPLGQGIITDERRTSVAQARALRDVANAEQQALINKLLVRAAKAYGEWYGAVRRSEIAAEGVSLAQFRADATRERVRAGDSPAVDTLEAMLEVRRRRVTLLEAQADSRVTALVASTFLWNANGTPLEIAATSRPVMTGLVGTAPDTSRLAGWLREAERRHPELLKADGKVRVANADRLLAAQSLLPDAEGGLSSIGARDDIDALTRRDGWGENFKGSLTATTSLLLRKERGKLAGTSQKLEFARLDRDLIRRDVAYGIRIALTDVTLLEQLLVVQRGNVEAAGLLRDAEQVRLDNGESTLLTINLRERLVLDEAIKLATLEGKLAAARAMLVAAIGTVTALQQ
ncbi:MAG TPA: TolC family protein [Gemmatimonas sp.]|nr:TolC family protein [Gemmatimonas sp.]